MNFLHCILMLIFVIHDDTLELNVQGSATLVVPLGGSVVLPCYVETPLVMESVRVEWTRTDSDILVHLFKNGDIRPEAQHHDYHDRAHFFTEDIKHGNFSLLLNNLTAEDKGVYRCKVYSNMGADKTLVTIKEVEYLIVSGSDQLIFAYVGDDVTMSCSVDSHIKPEEIEEVSWKKRDKDEEIPVLLYQNNKNQSESSDDRYRDRVEFFTDEIHRGNFSLRLKRVRTEDKGVYICQVFNGELSANTTVILETLGFSVLHIMVLILCITTCVSTLLFFSLIYCRSNNTEKNDRTRRQKHRVPEIHWRNPEDMELCRLQENLWSLNETRQDPVFRFQMCLVFCPNLIMFFAFIFWGVSEGSVNETICCCALYFLRPLTLLWAAPYINEFQGVIKELILNNYVGEYLVLTAVAYSALFADTSEKFQNFTEFDRNLIYFLYFIIFQFCLGKIIYIGVTVIGRQKAKILYLWDILTEVTFEILPTIQFIVLFYTFAAKAGFLIIVAILPLMLTATNERMFWRCYVHFRWSGDLRRKVQVIVTLVMNAVMIGFYIFTLKNQTDPIGWACVLMFLQVIWVLVRFLDQSGFSRMNISLDFPRNVRVYVFGSVGVVLISAVALITELTLKTVNGERALMDLRFIVFPSECFFILSVMILGQLNSNALMRVSDEVDSEDEKINMLLNCDAETQWEDPSVFDHNYPRSKRRSI